MKPVPMDVLNRLSGAFHLDAAELKPLGGGRQDSDGVTYTARRDGQALVLKIVGKQAAEEHALRSVLERAAFFAYLGEHGVRVVSPIRNAAGNLIESEAAGEDLFIAYAYPYLEGEHPRPERWTPALIAAWGETIGRAHRIAKGYPVTDGVEAAPGKRILTWRQEIEGFHAWCGDADVKGRWLEYRDRIEALGETTDDRAFIHNDPHMENVLVDGGEVCLLDFDVACCHHFACDLAIAIQSVLFTRSGGLERPVSDSAALKDFVEPLLKGYSRAISPPADLLDRIELFIGYRRTLLFTVMQDWLSTQPQVQEQWKRRILEEPRIMPL